MLLSLVTHVDGEQQPLPVGRDSFPVEHPRSPASSRKRPRTVAPSICSSSARDVREKSWTTSSVSIPQAENVAGDGGTITVGIASRRASAARDERAAAAVGEQR